MKDYLYLKCYIETHTNLLVQEVRLWYSQPLFHFEDLFYLYTKDYKYVFNKERSRYEIDRIQLQKGNYLDLSACLIIKLNSE